MPTDNFGYLSRVVNDQNANISTEWEKSLIPGKLWCIPKTKFGRLTPITFHSILLRGRNFHELIYTIAMKCNPDIKT
jgi:hypothetical protein